MKTMPHISASSFPPLVQSITDVTRRLSPSDVAATVIGTSSVTYLVLKRYEPQEYFFRTVFLIFLCVPALLVLPRQNILKSTPLAVLAAYTSHWTLLLFTAAYRLSPFHLLVGYPGPLLPRLTKWWTAYQIARHGQMHLKYQQLFQQYGDYMRVGPNELCVRDGRVVHSVLGTTGLPKGPYFSNRAVLPTLRSEREPAAHAARRKPWARGLTTQAIKDYELIVSQRLEQLITCIEKKVAQNVNEMADGTTKGAVLNLTKWMSYFTTDFMGDGIWEIMEGGIVSLAMVLHVPWMLKFLNAVSGGKEVIERARRLGRRKVSEPLKLGARRKNLFYYLTDEEGTGRIRPSDAALASDGLLAIIAGSDTTSTTFMALFWNLVKNPQAYARLQREIDSNFARGELPCDVNKMVEMGYLNACISETLRLFPALPSGSPRYVPLGGGPKVLGKHVVPGMQVLLHTWAIHRDPRYFSPSPDSFIPERWLTPDELSRADIDVFKVLPPETTVHDINAYFPFSVGPANCVGKNLALMEMRMVVCQLLHLFRFSRFEGDPVDEWEHDLQEFLIYKKPDVFVRIERR